MNTAILTIAAFVVLIAALAALRIYSNGRLTVEIKEIVAAISVVGLGLFVLGEVTEIAFGDIKLVRRVEDAKNTKVRDRIPEGTSVLVFERQHTDEKAGPAAIPKFIETKVTALSYRLGSNYYVASMVAQYLLALTDEPYLRFIVFNDDQERLKGIADARAIASAFRSKSEHLTPELLTNYIKTGNIEELGKLPGFVSSDLAVKDSATTRQALDRIVQNHAELLPVVNESGAFRGIVYRDQLVLAILDAFSGAETKG